MGKHISGKKFGKHSTIIDAAIPVVKFLDNLEEVKKISLGQIKTGLRNAPERIRIKTLKGALEITVRSSISLQKIHVYSNDLELIINKMNEYYRSTDPEITF
jgi:hypothetical protein